MTMMAAIFSDWIDAENTWKIPISLELRKQFVEELCDLDIEKRISDEEVTIKIKSFIKECERRQKEILG